MKRFVKVAAIAAVSAASVAFAQVIPLVNPGFETDFAAAGTLRILVPAGWRVFDPSRIVNQSQNSVGVLNPTGTTFFPGVPEGRNAALIFLAQSIGRGEVGLFQMTNVTLQPNTRYRLSVDVGNIASGFGDPNNFFYDLDGFPGYAARIFAANTILAEDRNGLFNTLSEGEFARTFVEFSTQATHPQMNQVLGVALINLNTAQTPQNPGIEVNFDDVRFEIVPPCIADFNADGGVDGEDVGAFFTAWSAADPSSDANQDGGIDGTDVAVFFEAWSAGGC